MLEAFAPVFNVHLHDEVSMILDLEPYDGKALRKPLDASAQKTLKSADPVGHPIPRPRTDIADFFSRAVSRPPHALRLLRYDGSRKGKLATCTVFHAVYEPLLVCAATS